MKAALLGAVVVLALYAISPALAALIVAAWCWRVLWAVNKS